VYWLAGGGLGDDVVVGDDVAAAVDYDASPANLRIADCLTVTTESAPPRRLSRTDLRRLGVIVGFQRHPTW
jgi:hypothetical protein